MCDDVTHGWHIAMLQYIREWHMSIRDTCMFVLLQCCVRHVPCLLTVLLQEMHCDTCTRIIPCIDMQIVMLMAHVRDE